MSRKRCSYCKNAKDPTEYHKNRRNKDGLQSQCKSCRRDLYAYDPGNPGTMGHQWWVNSLRRLYNLAEEDWWVMYVSQDGRCAICHEESDKRLCVDHSHLTGEVRGLLCPSCNLALGGFKDDTVRLAEAIKYLERDV